MEIRIIGTHADIATALAALRAAGMTVTSSQRRVRFASMERIRWYGHVTTRGSGRPGDEADAALQLARAWLGEEVT